MEQVQLNKVNRNKRTNNKKEIQRIVRMKIMDTSGIKQMIKMLTFVSVVMLIYVSIVLIHHYLSLNQNLDKELHIVEPHPNNMKIKTAIPIEIGIPIESNEQRDKYISNAHRRRNRTELHWTGIEHPTVNEL